MTRVVYPRSEEVNKMLNVEQCNPVLISSPSATVTYHKRASSVPLIELRHSDDEDGDSLESENISVNESSDLNNETDSASLCSKGGICSVIDSVESMRGGRGVTPMVPPTVRIKHITRSVNGSTRFPKLDECAHFHYENVELGPVSMGLYDERQDAGKTTVSGPEKENELRNNWFCVRVISNGRLWTVRRSYDNFRMLDRQLHRCVYDRKYSLLPELVPLEQLQFDDEEYLRNTLTSYLDRFSDLAGSLISCGPVLNWLELDNRGNRLIVPDESAINTPAVAAAYVVRRYTAQATDEISFEVGDMISVIDMPPPEESTWWRGKKGFEVGFFPCECVEVIGDKVPHTIKVPKAPTKPVLRKHGKLIAFFRSFLLSRPSRRKLKQSGILKERVFGCDLGEHLLNTGREIPLVLKCCTEFIEEHGIVDGIYRLSGVNSNIQKLRLAFDEDRIPDLTDEAILQDIHCVASLLKMYFRELPNPLLTYQLYDKFVNAVQSEEEVRLLKLRDVVQQLPPPHYRTLEYLMLHLAKVAGHGGRTGMTPKNVAIVWAPNLLRSKDVEGGGVGALHVVGVQAVLTEYLIRYADLIFNEKLLTFQSPGLDESSPRRARPKSLAISTPTKLLSLEEARSRALSANLPPTQQKYIDVGGGPDNLPPKYHTVIDFPGGKRGSGKIKKSPSGWKSFFSRGWHSGSTREKDRVCPQRKVSSGSLQHTSLPIQDVAITEIDISHTKKLRSVKSAESLVLLGGGSSCRNSGSSETFSISGLGKSREMSNKVSDGKESLMDYVESDRDSQESPCLSLSSPHLKHNRSSSHESYFEQDMDIPAEEQELEDSSMYDLIKKTMNKMKKESEKDIECQITETNFEYQEQQQIKTLTETEILESSDMIDAKDVNSVKQSDNQSEIHKSVRKQKLQNVETEVANAKIQKLSSTKSIEKHSEEVTNDGQLLSEIDKTSSLKINKTDCSLQNIFSDVEESNISSANKMEDSIIDKVNEDNENEKDQDNKEESKVVVERYGNEETIIVEVHATQESSDEEADKFYSSNLNNKQDLIDYEDIDISKQNREIDSGNSNNKVYENKDVLNNENNIIKVDKIPVIESNLEDSMNNEANHSSIIVDTDKTQDEDISLVPELKPGSLISEVMEEYLLIKKSLDKTHSKEQQQNNNNNESVALYSKSNAFICEDSEHLSKDETTLVSLDDNLDNLNETVSANKCLLLAQRNLDNKNNINLLDNKSEEFINEIELKQESVESKSTNFDENLKTECKDPKILLSKESRQNSRFLENVQLRHISNKSKDKCSVDHKRNSEPQRSTINKHIHTDSSERKHMSEISSSKLEEKNTVKGLMLKFETAPKNSNETCSSEKHLNSTKDIVSKPKTNHPSLFTQLKVLKLQSLHSGSSMTSPSEPIDPWSDPILDIEEQKESQSIPLNNRPSLIVQRDKSPENINESSTENETNEISNLVQKHVETKSKITKENKERKGAMGLSISTPDLADNNNVKVLDENDTSVPLCKDSSISSNTTNQSEDEIIKRERINRIKEERRAQLREKLRSESFRLEAEEKEKVLNEFRFRKHNNSTKTNSSNTSEIHKKEIVPKSEKNDKESKLHSSRIKCATEIEKSAIQHREVPKPRINTSVSKGLTIMGNITEKQEKNKLGNNKDNSDSVQEKSISKVQSPTNRCDKISYRSPTKERLKKAVSLDSSKQSLKTETKPTSPISKTTKNFGEKSDKKPLSSEKHLTQKSPNSEARRVLPSQCISAVSQKRIRERAAMFEHPKDTQEMCRTNTSSSRFTRQRSSPSLNPSFVR